MIDWTLSNKRELMEIIETRGRTLGLQWRLRGTVSHARLVELIETERPPLPEELAMTCESRARLEKTIKRQWGMLESQLPCTGENRGRCTIYPCSEIMHLDCYNNTKIYHT